MKVAVPVFNDDVSPRFGCSTQVLVATIDNDGLRIDGVQDLRGLPPWQWPELFARLGVTKVICGGVHARFLDEMERRGMEVFWGVIGPATAALAALQSGTLRRDQFVCRRHRHRRGARWGGPPRVGHGPSAGGNRGGRGFGRGRGPMENG